MRISVALCVAFSTVCAVALDAQKPDSQVVAWGDRTRASGPGHVQVWNLTCLRSSPAIVHANALANSSGQILGGVAYDAARRAVWLSDGFVLELHALVGGRRLSRSRPTPHAPGAVVSGLAVHAAAKRLYVLETRPGHMAIVEYSIATLPPRPTTRVGTVALANRGVSCGLAYDDARGAVYFTVTVCTVSGCANTLHAAAPLRPGNPLCRERLVLCGAFPGIVTAVGYDPRSNQVHVQHASLETFEVLDFARCRFRRLGCCGSTDGRGLAVMPGSTYSAGPSCLPRGCGSCASMRAEVIGGISAFGDSSFGMRITGGPQGHAVSLLLAAGVCGLGRRVSPGCGLLFPDLAKPSLAIPGGVLQGAAGCDGKGGIGLPIPNVPSLRGAELCAQWLVAAVRGCTTGVGMTNAIGFRITRP